MRLDLGKKWHFSQILAFNYFYPEIFNVSILVIIISLKTQNMFWLLALKSPQICGFYDFDEYLSNKDVPSI